MLPSLDILPPGEQHLLLSSTSDQTLTLMNPQLFQNCPELQSPPGAGPSNDLASQWLSIATTWRMLMLGSKEGNRGSVSSMAVLFHEVAIIEEAFRKLYEKCSLEICPIVRSRSPRLNLAPDRLILEAAADVDGSSSLSLNALLSFCFMGLHSVSLSPLNGESNGPDDSVSSHPLLLPGAMNQSPTMFQSTKSQDAGFIKKYFEAPKHFVSSVFGVSGGKLIMDPSAEAFTCLGPGTSLASLVTGLDGTLRRSFLEATRSCLEACGRMQVDEWVGFFPARCVILVDAAVWTQTAASALSRLNQGERNAMR